MTTPEAFVYDAIRTPRGRGKSSGSLHTTKPIDLVTGLLSAMLDRNPGLDPARVDDLVLGVVSPIGEQGGDIARTAALAAGLPDTVAGLQVNRFCASGLESVNIAAQKVRSGFEDLVFAGGVESMSRVPMSSDGAAWMDDPATNLTAGFVPQGIGADLIATLDGYSRADVDEFAVRSHELAARAEDQGRFDGSTVPVRDLNGTMLLDRNETIRPGTTVQTLEGLKSSFAGLGRAGFDAVAIQEFPSVERIDHVHHAGNSSGIVDGAALVAVGSAEVGRDLGLAPKGRVVSTAVSGDNATIMLTAPAPASRKALAKAGLEVSDIDLFEINEAFASVVLHFAADLGVDMDNVNVNGGAIAMGHPLGATGAMLVSTVLDELHRTGGRYGLITLCVGGGMGIATVVEAL
ncbi:MAG: acetyl-CoA C-acetyltransferase [Gordonia sp. (in: high G+C Gram-positive bacteria)]|uniref:acetyl-CoA C-acetyltransferase n=1 Tax=Gordonia sp. (in: high G+C Gram-positive bacteria) TaxID=84139 RepID=UPI003BB593F0